MDDVVIRVENLSKRYRIGGREKADRTFREVLMGMAAAPFRRLQRMGNDEPPEETIWALRGVSLEVKRGGVLGIIGRNGAGKSTLLKILSRITEPTDGRVEIRGRVGSLLDVGTGFHEELTGRENIYLNGAILGMKKEEIDRKFDEIVAFSEIEKFLDTPVKRYSSGMYVRLAFAVAAHLEPEILMVDEVLAVGDVDFQKKCIGSMESVAKSGRTVLVVSHNLALIESLCGTGLLLSDGKVESCGPTQDVVSDYLAKSRLWGSESLLHHPRRTQNSSAKFSRICIADLEGNKSRELKMGSGITVTLGIVANEPVQRPWIGVRFRTPFNQLVCHVANREAGYELETLSGNCVVNCHIQRLNLLPGRYFVDLILADMLHTLYDEVPSAAYFDIKPADVFRTGMPMGQQYGSVFFASRWESTKKGHDGNSID